MFDAGHDRHMTNNGLIALAVFVGLLLNAVLLARRLLRASRRVQLDPDTHVVVDGSNVMHWGGEPSAQVLKQVLHAFGQKGLTPLIVFDANVGYKLWGRHAHPKEIAKEICVHPDTIEIVPSGTPADGWLLGFAAEQGMNVVSNDRFLDWRDDYPQIDDTIKLVKGSVHDGVVRFRAL